MLQRTSPFFSIYSILNKYQYNHKNLYTQLVHNFVVSLKRTPLSCRSHFFIWKIHWSLTLPVHFSFSRGCQKIMKQWTLPLSSSPLQLLRRNTACISSEFHAVLKMFHKELLNKVEKMHETFQPSGIFSKPLACLSLVTLNQLAVSFNSISLYFMNMMN